MTHLAWTAAAFRILAVWLACGTLIGVPGTLGGLFGLSQIEPVQPLSTLLLPAFAVWITSGLIVAALWYWSDRLATLVWRDNHTPVVSSLESHALQQAVLVGFGVYLVVFGLPNLTELAAGYYTLPTGVGLEQSYAGRMWARAIGVGIQIAAGVLLIVQSGAAARWLTRRSSEADDDDADA